MTIPAISLLALALAGPASAEDPAQSVPVSDSSGGVHALVQLTVGGRLPLSDLGPGLLPTLEAGLRLPVAGGRLSTVATFGYSQARAEGEGDDDRFPGTGAWSWTLRQREWVLGALAIGRLWEPGSRAWSPELTIGPQWHHQVSVADGSADGSSFGEYRELSNRLGFTAAVGAAFDLGPGEGMVRLGVTGSSLNSTLVGQSIGTLGPSASAGYRLVF